jgi:excisionase family DNA binding protein
VSKAESEDRTVCTTAEIAQRLRVSNESVRREIRRGQLRAMQIGRLYRTTAADLIDWLGEQRYKQLFAIQPSNAPKGHTQTSPLARRGRM